MISTGLMQNLEWVELMQQKSEGPHNISEAIHQLLG